MLFAVIYGVACGFGEQIILVFSSRNGGGGGTRAHSQVRWGFDITKVGLNSIGGGRSLSSSVFLTVGAAVESLPKPVGGTVALDGGLEDVPSNLFIEEIAFARSSLTLKLEQQETNPYQDMTMVRYQKAHLRSSS